MKHVIFNNSTLLALLSGVILLAGCRRELEVEPEPDYSYRIGLMPVQGSIQKSETVALEFSVHYTGYEGAAFTFRYTQPEGEGFLSIDSTTICQQDVNYPIPADGFITLFYTSDCQTPQKLDFVFTDKFDIPIEYTVQFDPQTLPDYGFNVTMEPVKERLRNGEQADMEFTLTCNRPYEGAAYTVGYSQSEGTGKLVIPGYGSVTPVQDYDIPPDGKIAFTYTSACHENQKLVFVFKDKLGNRVEHTVAFDGMPYPYFGIEAPENVSLPVSGTATLNFVITGIEQYEDKGFTFSYAQTAGSGALSDSKGSPLSSGQLYPIAENGQFTLKYRPKSGSRSHRLTFTVEDLFGNRQEKVININ